MTRGHERITDDSRGCHAPEGQSAACPYKLVKRQPKELSNSEILAVCKILLDSRSMRKDEMLPILDKLVDCCVPANNRRAVNTLLSNEKFHYIEPHHGKPILDTLWELGQAVQTQEVIEIAYRYAGAGADLSGTAATAFFS